MLTLFLYLYSLINSAMSAECASIFQDCGRSSQESMTSLPNLGSAANLNPSNLAHVGGLKAEILYRSHNKVQFNLLTGSHEVGAGVISPQAENAFFGNRTIELDDDAKSRISEDKNYDSKKVQFATGFTIFNTEEFGLDLGASIRRSNDIKDINLGAGCSLRVGHFNLGFSAYYDDVMLDFQNYINPNTNNLYQADYSSRTYKEKFLVKTFSSGLNFEDFSIDASFIKTEYDFYKKPTSISIISSSLYSGNLLTTIGYRHENSDNLKQTKGRTKDYLFALLQYAWGHTIQTGLIYNNFLQNDITAQLILSF